MCTENKKSKFSEGLLIGVLLGVGAYLLLGTTKGRKIKDEISDKTGPYVEELWDLIESWKEEGEDKVGKIKEAVEERLADEPLSHIEKLQERGREATDNLKKKLFFKNTKKVTP